MIFPPNDDVLFLGRNLGIGKQYNDILHNYFDNLGYHGSLPDQLRQVGPTTPALLELATIMSDRDGFLYDYSNINTLNQLSTGTTPVTAVTDPVGLVMDTRLGLQASTKGAYLAGAVGTWLSSPDSVAASITGDIDISCKVALTDWTPTTFGAQSLISKIGSVGQYSYGFRVDTTGNLTLRTSVDGTALQTQTSSVAPTVTDGASLHVRVKRIAATGVATFYTSTDGSAWTQLGSTQASTPGAIFDGTDILRIGAELGLFVSGKVYSLHIYNGIRESGGTLAVNFNGTDYSTGSTLTSSTTGEVWTLNGAAYIAPDGNHSIQATAGARPTWEVDAQGFHYLKFLGTDDSLTSATGGGGSAGFFWCGVVQPTGGAGTDRFLYSDRITATPSGYSVYLSAANKLGLQAGNGAAFTSKVSTATVDVGTKYLLTVWDDGVNLNVQINSATVETVARPVVVGGTSSYSISKTNEGAAGYITANLYPDVYWKDTAGTAAERADAQAYCRALGGM